MWITRIILSDLERHGKENVVIGTLPVYFMPSASNAARLRQIRKDWAFIAWKYGEASWREGTGRVQGSSGIVHRMVGIAVAGWPARDGHH